MKLLTVQNAKTVKGEAEGYLTGILYMAPHTTATTKSLCPFSTPGCRAACLYSAGRGRFSNVQEARIRKARWFASDQDSFMDALVGDVHALIRKANKLGKKLAIRLNGTTDIRWERIYLPYGNKLNIMQLFPDVQFYDYTKWPKVHRWLLPANYDLTFSYAETERNHEEAVRWLEHGYRVAIVFKHKPLETSVIRVSDYPCRVIDGDKHDLTFLYPGNCALALKAKGAAKQDTSGFVQRSWSAMWPAQPALVNIKE